LTAPSKESKFVEKGTLTPEEFMEAGDQLVFKFPTWQWESGEKSRGVGYLDADKQFLITRNVPCRDRVRALDFLANQTRTDGEWSLPETAQSAEGEAEDPKAESSGAKVESSGGGFADATDDFIAAPAEAKPDFSDLDAALNEEDPAAAPAFGGGGGYFVAEAPDAHIVKTRTYDLSITYDKYYQTPRLWLFGYDEDGAPLNSDDVYEDVLSEYKAKTVTFDPHPHSGIPTVSIHPCKHSLVMKKIVDDWIEKGITPRVDFAMFVFLKFISGIVPTINYDFTMDIEF